MMQMGWGIHEEACHVGETRLG